MYSELIYTRCGEGVDILRGRNPIKNSGFKVFSCSDQVTQDGFTDLPLLYATAQSKEPYTDPSFMDDAYLFVVPDFGGKFLLNFHPIPFDRNAAGDYSHRPGNFINQIFIGQFDDIYPYETFGNESVWTAQKRGEAFYYENPPVPLGQRDELTNSVGSIGLGDIAAFVADGRRGALMSAVAFVVSQYSLPPEERKFLVIRDENSRQIELWVAAIESAFSPRMASGLSFATRLDKFVNANKYTVNLSGQYQTQINLQSPTQKLRYRAMIVGVDERDKTNSAAAKALANSPYVILDGKSKTLSVSVDTSNPYYRYATAYDEGHTYLCREFMQMVDISSPTSDVLKLYTAYAGLSSFSLKGLLSSLTILNQYRLVKTPCLERLYSSVKQALPQYLKEDTVSAFSILSWLERTSAIVGDPMAGSSFKDIVCHSYADNIFTHPQSRAASELQNAVKKSPFAQSAAEYTVSQAVVSAYYDAMQAYEPADWAAFSKLFAECLKYSKGSPQKAVNTVLPMSVNALYRAGDVQNALQAAALYSALNTVQTAEILLNEAGQSSDQNYRDFIVQLIPKISPESVSSESSLARFYHQLQNYGLESSFTEILAYRARTIRAQDMERFLDWILSNQDFEGLELSLVFQAIDHGLFISDKTVGRVAAKIQNHRPKGVACVNSAHLYALEVLDDKRLADDLPAILDDLASQGFPALEDETYARKLASKLFGTKLSEDAFSAVVAAASSSAFYSALIADEALKYLGSRQDAVVGEFLELAAQTDSKTLFDSLVNACADMKQFDKGMSAMRATIRSQDTQRYFTLIEKEARVLHDQKKGPSLWGRLFSRGPSSNFDPGKRGR